MDPTALVASVQEQVPGARIELAPSVDLQTTLQVSRDDLVGVARALRDRADLRFSVLAELTAVDDHPADPRFEVVYILISIARRQRVRVKVRLPGADARVPTLSGLWLAANWLEREVWDLFGIEFDGHPDLRRLLMPEDWDGFPLRKDYPVQIQMAPRVAEPLQVTAREFREQVERDRSRRRG